MSELICKVEIPKYLKKIVLSKARREKHFELGKGKAPPKKYTKNSRYEWKRCQVGKRQTSKLVDTETKKFVVANPIAAGTPKFQRINGQDLYAGNLSVHTRNKIFTELKEFFIDFIKDIKEIKNTPVKIHLEVHDEIIECTSLWDLDNRAYPYKKAFQDTLTGNRGKYEVKLEDDNILFVTNISTQFVPVDNTEDRKLVYLIYKEDDNRVLKHKAYKK
jgi:hypothetical protein